MTEHRLTIEGRIDQVAKLSDLVERIAREAGFSGRELYALQLAVYEAAENIIAHGYRGDSTNLIEVQVDTNSDTLRIELWDDAPPFNPAAERAETAWEVDDPPVGGLGLKIMHKVMDEIRYERRGKRNWLSMLKHRGPQGPAQGS